MAKFLNCDARFHKLMFRNKVMTGMNYEFPVFVINRFRLFLGYVRTVSHMGKYINIMSVTLTLNEKGIVFYEKILF